MKNWTQSKTINIALALGVGAIVYFVFFDKKKEEKLAASGPSKRIKVISTRTGQVYNASGNQLKQIEAKERQLGGYALKLP